MKFLLKLLLRIMLPIILLFVVYLFLANGNKLPGTWTNNKGDTTLVFQGDNTGMAIAQESRGIAGIRLTDEAETVSFGWDVKLGRLDITVNSASEPQKARFLIFGDTMFFFSDGKITILKRQ